MADVRRGRRWWTAGHTSVAWLVASWAFVAGFLGSRAGQRLHLAIEDGIYRVFSGFPWAQELVHRIYDVLDGALAYTAGITLLAATIAMPVAFFVRRLAGARVRAGLADPFDGARAWLAGRAGRSAAVLAALPALSQAYYLFVQLRWNHWSPAYFVAFALAGGLAQMAVVRGALRALLAPISRDGAIGPVGIDPDEIRFDAVAVTRETRLAVGALATLSLATAAWLVSVPVLALFKDPRIFTVIAAYVGVAAASAVVFRRASKIAVGVDGIYVGGTSRPRFFAYRDLDDVRARGGDLELVRRGRVILRLQLHGADVTRREAILSRISEALGRVKDVERDAAANFVTSRSVERVVDSARGGGDYRMPSVSQDALWALVEGQAVDAKTRTAAAEALARASGGANRDRLRVAAAHCADPRVRVALEELGSDTPDDDDEARAPRKSATA